jgi:hypothetical protein
MLNRHFLNSLSLQSVVVVVVRHPIIVLFWMAFSGLRELAHNGVTYLKSSASGQVFPASSEDGRCLVCGR